MSGRSTANLDAHIHFGIFGLVAFESPDAESTNWAQIGTAKRNRQGFLDLTDSIGRFLPVGILSLDRPLLGHSRRFRPELI